MARTRSMIARMSRTPGRSARIMVAIASIVAMFAAATPPPVSGWANAGNGYATHDWIVDKALEILDAAGQRPAWFDRDLALPYTDDPDTIEQEGESLARLGACVLQRDDPRRCRPAHLGALHGGPGRPCRGGRGGSDDQRGPPVALPRGHLSALPHGALRTREVNAAPRLRVRCEGADPTVESAPEWADATQAVTAVADIRKTAAATASYSRARFADLYRIWKATGDIDDPIVNQLTGQVLKRGARDLANVIWSLDQGTGRSPDMASFSARVRWVGARRGDHRQVVLATVKDADGNGIRGAEIQISWPLPDGTRKLYRTWTDKTGLAVRTITVGKLPMLRRQDVPIVAIVNGTTLERRSMVHPEPEARRRPRRLQDRDQRRHPRRRRDDPCHVACPRRVGPTGPGAPGDMDMGPR